MPRKKLINPTVPLNVHLDPQVHAGIEALLFSEAERRVPYGAWQRFLNRLLAQALEQQELDLAPYSGAMPGTFAVRGHPAALQHLKQLLEKK